MNPNIEKVIIRPEGSLQILSYQEAEQLSDMSAGGLNDLLKQCALAVLNTGSNEDSGLALLEAYPDFDIQVTVKGRGVQLVINHPPKHAFVDGEMIVGLKEHLYAVLRDLVYARNEILESGQFKLNDSFGITNAIFHIARNAQLLQPNTLPNVIVCWGGHAISVEEYDYSKHQGYELGLRNLDICTGCGPGAMKGPMKGAVLGHGKQRYADGRYIGITEPGIIAAEAPNAIVNELCIFPDIEKRLEAFVRIGHGIVVFPGGAGTMEEILYLLSILLHPKNANIPFPLVLSGPTSSQAYFESIAGFVRNTLGEAAVDRLNIIINEPRKVAREMKQAMEAIRQDRKESSDAYYFNWRLHIELDQQQPFIPSHENMANLNLHKNQPPHELASQLRKAFSGIVAGNVKADGIREIEFHGPFEINGDPDIMQEMDSLLQSFVEQKRMKIDASTYNPCYKIIR
ncbi:MAG: nucleotide 5'-monophosphate nucleosidase PpnN [Thiomicrorhabdus chilensis]|uniref:nucleotide 5'-monophosphate nucleosidase PpnN n=1 Tax=Thiomicrorhabdus chilensis TaxID=63656 RepID=UPI00299F5106|nr:nucleotide 5'-monophosphate nucleosidase PpnN [Thiomicrorhabdus chilensis]MDX1347873.1 nucleotide 5'-monophosphate nucleosidase PpnN [Thiomicrorhabdus chilensis]